MRFRQAEPPEAAALTALVFASKAHWGYAPAQMELWREELTIMPQDIAAFPVHVAELDGRVAGVLVLIPAPGLWELKHFWVAPSHIRQGVGRPLFSHAVALAREGGATGLHLVADPYAEGFYSACGATRVGSTPWPIEGQPHRVLPLMQLAFNDGAKR